MTEAFTIEVITNEKWRKEYPLTKGIVHIGSGPMSDIRLESNGQGPNVAPLHAQLIASGETHASFNLVNMSNSAIPLGTTGNESLPPCAVFELSDGQIFWLGPYQLIFHGGGSGGRTALAPAQKSPARSQRSIGLRLSLAQTRLAPHQTLEGTVVVSNLGPVNATISVDLEGLDEDCFEIAPGPLLSSGAEKAVVFRLYHRGAKPPAGECQVTIRAVAPKSYPGEQVTVSQVIQVLPHFQHRLRLLPGADLRLPADSPIGPATDRPGPSAGEAASLWVAPEPVLPPRPAPSPVAMPEIEKSPEVAPLPTAEVAPVEITLPPAPVAAEPPPAPPPQPTPWWQRLKQRWPFGRPQPAAETPAQQAPVVIEPVLPPPEPPLWPVEPEPQPEPAPPSSPIEPTPVVRLPEVESISPPASEPPLVEAAEEPVEPLPEEAAEAAETIEPAAEPEVTGGEVVPLPTKPAPVDPVEIWATTEADVPAKPPVEEDVWSGEVAETGSALPPPVIRLQSRPVPPVKKPVEVEVEAIWASEEDNDDTA